MRSLWVLDRTVGWTKEILKCHSRGHPRGDTINYRGKKHHILLRWNNASPPPHAQWLETSCPASKERIGHWLQQSAGKFQKAWGLFWVHSRLWKGLIMRRSCLVLIHSWCDRELTVYTVLWQWLGKNYFIHCYGFCTLEKKNKIDYFFPYIHSWNLFLLLPIDATWHYFCTGHSALYLGYILKNFNKDFDFKCHIGIGETVIWWLFIGAAPQ